MLSINQTNDKYVLCKPMIRGFNDMMCTITKCYEYCKNITEYY